MSLIGHVHRTLVYDRRVRRLSELLSEIIPPSCNLLDVGSGDGKLAWSLLKRRPDLTIEGLDVLLRERTAIPVKSFDGTNLPYVNSSFDAVMLVDVLHHTADPGTLLREAVRVTRRWLIVKDHRLNGFAAGLRLRMMDRAGNLDHGVALPYNYISERQWEELERTLNVKVATKINELRLYRWPLNYIFGSGLHFLDLYEK
ncbi:MAG: class I SAM-dependent methyltransferase [Terriglobales bacterium]|jgi:SAM-dependent methyltransferase|nr:class I SAM-dependent methyltransferase [Terriglobales bacterium]